MKRRSFLKGMTATGLLSVLDPACLSAKENWRQGRPTESSNGADTGGRRKCYR